MALSKRRIAAASGFCLEDVRCACDRSSWSEPEDSSAHAIVFVRRGCFRRRADGVESVLDPAAVYVERPGQEQQVAHPADGGDACTQITLPADFAGSFGDETVTTRPWLTPPDLDLAHRLLLRARTHDDFEFTERVVSLAAQVLSPPGPYRSAKIRPVTAAARRRIVDTTREAIATDPTLGLLQLAQISSVSPHHLSRTFRSETGETVSRYRNRIRVRLALERLAEGEPRLARLAAELGFADQAHLARVVRNEVDRTPSELRAALAPA